MSHIDDLIQKLCPDGVPYTSLLEVADFVRGVTYNKSNEQTDGPISVLRANNITLSSNTLNFTDVKRVSADVKVRDNQLLRSGDVLICAGSGSKEHIGKVAFIDKDMTETFGGFMGVVRSKEKVLPRFLFHLLTGGVFSDYLRSALSTTTINNLNAHIMKGFQVPVPPIAVQREIVRILDKFTALEAELEAELEARKQQYEHYRNELLTPGADTEWSTLGGISTRVTSGGTPTAGKAEFYENGTIPWLRTNEVRFTDIWDTEMRITEEAVKQTSAKWIPANSVIVAISGATAGRSAITRIPLTTNQHCCNIEVDPSKADFHYVFHWVASRYGELKALGRGARSDLNAAIIKSFPISVPSLDEQRRIVERLDAFDALTSDLSVGLPAELAARRRQYEYYRDGLLSFRELGVGL